MKKLLFLLVLIPCVLFGQITIQNSANNITIVKNSELFNVFEKGQIANIRLDGQDTRIVFDYQGKYYSILYSEVDSPVTSDINDLFDTLLVYKRSSISLVFADGTELKQLNGKAQTFSHPYGYEIAEGNIPDHSAIYKFGSNPDVGTSVETIWSLGGLYPWADVSAAAGNVKISSSSDFDGGISQVETATVGASTVTTSGDADVIVTSAGMSGSPKTINVAVFEGTLQIETQTIVGTVTTSGNASLVVTGSLVSGSPLTIPFAVVEGTLQIETATAAGTVTTSGDADVIVTSDGMTNSPKTINVAVVQGTAQVETQTIVGTIDSDGAGDINVIVTGALVSGSPLTIPVTVANDDTDEQVAAKVQTALAISAITDNYSISGATTDIILTADAVAADDATLNIAYDNGTATGLTPNATSVNTIGGVAQDLANSIAAKIRAALIADADVGHPTTGKFTITGETDAIILTAKDLTVTDDATLNVNIADGTSTGVTTAATSADTEAGVIQDTDILVGGKARTALGIAAITDNYTVSGSGADMIMTADAKAADDATLNIEIANGTAAGLTPNATSVDTEAGVAQDVTNTVAAKIRAALIADVAVGHPTTGKFTITGTGAEIILTQNAPALADDGTLNVNIADGTSVGVATSASSANTTSGVVASGALTCTIYGLSSVDSTELSESITLAGQTAVVSSGSYYRVNRIIVNTAGSGLVNAGVIYVGTGSISSGVPAVKWASAPVGETQTLQAVWTVPKDKTFYMTSFTVSTDSNKGTIVNMYTRPDDGGVFNIKNRTFIFSAPMTHAFEFPLVLTGGTDIDCRGKGTASGGGISFTFEGWYE